MSDGNEANMPEAETKTAVSPWNGANLMTAARILLAVVVFCLLPFGLYKTALVLFLIAALTDKLDGWYARKYNLITQLGRIMDPLADKLMICGTFVYLLTLGDLTTVRFGLRVWMVVVLISREMLVTTLRALIESHGGDFSAAWSGKIKMTVQCVAVALCLLYLCFETGTVPAWIVWIMIVSLWATVASTVYSGVQYVVAAIKVASEQK